MSLVTFSFSVPILAFGINVNTFATLPGSYTITTNLGDSAPSGFDPFPGFLTGQFVGLISDTPFTSVTFDSVGGFEYTLDDLTYAPVPEPGTMVLLGGALWGPRAFGSRRKKA